MEKKGGGYVLRAQPGVRVSSRAHKMSKSRGNVVNPDDVVIMYGADSLRLYEMFMGPLRDTKVCPLFEAHHMCLHGRWHTGGYAQTTYCPFQGCMRNFILSNIQAASNWIAREMPQLDPTVSRAGTMGKLLQ